MNKDNIIALYQLALSFCLDWPRMVFSVHVLKMFCRSVYVCRRLFRDFTYNSFVQKAEYKSAYSIENLYPNTAVKNASAVPESKVCNH